MTKLSRAIAALFLVVTIPAAEAAAQATCRNLRYRSNFRLNSAKQHLDVASRQGLPPGDKARRMRDAMTNLNEAARNTGADQLTLWYLFGQAYAIERDLRGADSSWTRAEAAAREANDADCLTELTRLRRNERVPLVNDGVSLMNGGNNDSALVLLRQAAMIFRGDPRIYVNMATAFYNTERNDSAAHYFGLAARTGTDSSDAEVRSLAAFNGARLLQTGGRFADAERLYREYLVMRPGDMAARTSLAAVLSSQGRADAAAAIYDSMLANADSLESAELFETGVALFRQAQTDTANPQMRSRKLTMAARAFELGLAKNPNHRDAIFNLTNTYLVADDTVRAAATARRLIANDPMNRNGYSLLAETFRRRSVPLRTRFEALSARRDSVAAAREVRARYQALTDSTLQLIQRRDSVPVEFTVQRFEPRDSTVAFRGALQNLQSREATATVIVVEFMNARGQVAATERIEIPALSTMGNPGSVYDFNLTVTARGVIGYRYRAGN